MKNIEICLKNAVAFQDYSVKRGYELMMASGCEWCMKTSPKEINFTESTVEMIFYDDYYCHEPNVWSISLDVTQLSKSDEEWSKYIEEVKQAKLDSDKFKAEEYVKQDLEKKKLQLEKLKKELGL